MNKKVTLKTNKLTEAENAQLHLWVSASPKQGLDWLEEAHKIACQPACAWQKNVICKACPCSFGPCSLCSQYIAYIS